GQTYYITVLNTTAATGGDFVLHLDEVGQPCPVAPPSNDLCTGAVELANFPMWDLVIREQATNDLDVSCNAPAATGAHGGVWYTYTPAQPGELFHAKLPDQGSAGGLNDTVVTVFSAATPHSCSSLTPIACVDAVEGYVNRFTTPIAALNAGTTYY